MNPAEILDRALEAGATGRTAPASVRGLLDVATEVAQALTASRLSRADHDRIYARSLAMLEAAVDEQRRGWQRALHPHRPAPVLIGGAALTLGAAALGWAVLHGRRSHAPVAA
ncbi:MAG: hypothetical protein JF886_02495 [Candidatus Dormibacteraeota bacterium]|uniref:Uncharacterized protein n=1 Tax=Candidatus Aeolococcus gillhamiae TaxID=3127015 RepID=A0A934JTN3_9BACT|nr:hypothetical protein [Candidatus Dormibacteraeota bacterium]